MPVNEAGAGDGAPGGAEAGTGRIAAERGHPGCWLRAKTLTDRLFTWNGPGGGRLDGRRSWLTRRRSNNMVWGTIILSHESECPKG
jgi:hypothetical protein